jgi:hypothetical protein
MSSRPVVAWALQEFPEHASIIGGMLLSYANLEALATDLVSYALGGRHEISKAARVLFRTRGANDRLQVADALLRPFAAELRLAGAYSQWLGAMRMCRILRNQYAHSAWSVDDNRLAFMSLEDAAKPSGGEAIVYYSPIDLPLLKEQEAYFDYAFKLMAYLAGEFRYRTDRRRTRYRHRLPKSRAAPKLHSPPG